MVALSELSDFTLICDVANPRLAGTPGPAGTAKWSVIEPAEGTPPEEALMSTVSEVSLMSVTSHVAVPSTSVVVTGGLMATNPALPAAENTTAWLLMG